MKESCAAAFIVYRSKVRLTAPTLLVFLTPYPRLILRMILRFASLIRDVSMEAR